jgi:hypothetical protein
VLKYGEGVAHKVRDAVKHLRRIALALSGRRKARAATSEAGRRGRGRHPVVFDVEDVLCPDLPLEPLKCQPLEPFTRHAPAPARGNPPRCEARALRAQGRGARAAEYALSSVKSCPIRLRRPPPARASAHFWSMSALPRVGNAAGAQRARRGPAGAAAG